MLGGNPVTMMCTLAASQTPERLINEDAANRAGSFEEGTSELRVWRDRDAAVVVNYASNRRIFLTEHFIDTNPFDDLDD